MGIADGTCDLEGTVTQPGPVKDIEPVHSLLFARLARVYQHTILLRQFPLVMFTVAADVTYGYHLLNKRVYLMSTMLCSLFISTQSECLNTLMLLC